MEKDEQLQKAMNRIKAADRIRHICLFPSLFIMLYLFYGAKAWEGVLWFEKSRMILYNVLFYAVLIMLASSVVKIFFAKSYNDLVKKKNKK